MAYRKIFIAVDCANEQEVTATQAAAKRMSEIFQLRASDVLALSPLVEKNGNLIVTTIRTISREGMRGLARMVPYLLKNIKK